ncbi:peptidase [Pseudoscardovia suis]|nr:peptidase [Pseudoscardovia suis]
MKNMIGTLLPGMRRARGTDGFRPTRQPAQGHGEGIVPAILALACDGSTMVDIASAVGMPVAFVRQVIESAAEDGRIDVASWRGTCASGTCTPQPTSLLCAGCPFRPRDSH